MIQSFFGYLHHSGIELLERSGQLSNATRRWDGDRDTTSIFS